MNNPTPLRWGVIGPGTIARKFAEGLADTETGILHSAASRDIKRAETFLNEFGGGKAYGDYQSLLDDTEVDAVYIATPHPFHAEWAIKAAKAGKHILCEKPVTLNHGEAMAVIDAAEVAGVFFMEAFMYRCHPQTAKLAQLVKDGVIGKILHIEASFGFDGGSRPESRHQANALGGGGILDVGCYPISMLRLIAGAANGKPFIEPQQLKGCGHLDEETGVDTWASAVLKFEGDIIGVASTGLRVGFDNTIVIRGSEGKIKVTSPWFCNGQIIVEKKGEEPEILEADNSRQLYSYEIDAVANHHSEQQAPSPAMSWDDTMGNMRALDLWRAELDFAYDQEKSDGSLPVVHGGPLGKRGDSIPTGSIPGLEKPVARLVMGCDNQRILPFGAAMFDDYFERGGNVFDNGTCYRAWSLQPSIIGQWMKHRGIREECVLLDKGAHTPWCWPGSMRQEMQNALTAHQTDYIDIYMMHRDNPQVPVGEFIDVITGMVEEGMIRVYGFSNWSQERLVEAITYAEKNGLAKPVCLSNQFSLAEMVNPLWAGCISSSTPEYRKWLTENNFALMPWSSQAHGFFTDRSAPEKRDIHLMVHGFYSDENFERKKRAEKLAADKGVLPLNIALAYVLSQPFPTFPLIGPRSVRETRTSLPGIDIKLTAEELAWLNLEK